MRLEHLKKVESYLEKSKGSVNKSKVRNDLNMDYNTVLNVLTYLIKEKKVRKFKEDFRGRSIDKFEWIKK